MSYDSKTAFVRQSSWMVIATFVGGMLMTLVHTVARKMGAEDYATFVTLLRLLIVLGIPSAALQTVFAQQAADAHDEEREQQLAATTRAILGLTFLLWLVVGLGVLGAYQPICRALKIADPVALGFTVLLVLTALWVPVLKGLLQGLHRFGGLGWLQIVDGVGRFGMTLVFVLALNGKAASTMFGCAIGQIATLALGAWFTRDIWTRHRAAAFPWRRWIKRALPLTMGLAAVLLMSSIDMLFVENHFSDTRLTALYGGAMLTGFAIVQFIAPVAAVMFPRIVRNVSKSGGVNSLTMALGATGLFGCVAAVGCTVLPWLPLRLMYFKNPEMWAAAPLVPWFAWAQLPLAVANVLTQNVLARSRFGAAPWLIAVPILYTGALFLQAPHLAAMKEFDAFTRIVQTQGVFCLLLCGVAAWFCRAPKAGEPNPLASSLRVAERI